jgi:protein TonB
MAAEVIVLNNTDFMFSGQIPPILRSIVVLNLSIDRDGALTRAVVQRSRNQKASLLALTAVRRVGDRFPKPQHLIHTGYQTLDFAETFLFNDDLRFQIRTLAGVQ